MSVLIKGMEMPKRCFECIFLTTVPNFFCLAGKRDLYAEHGINISRPDWCPLIEVPTPHGRLIDKVKLKRELFVNFMGERIPFYDCDNFPTTLTYIDLHSILSEQPTVIEAEE